MKLNIFSKSLMLSGWAEKDDFVEFPPVAIEKGSARFNGLTCVLQDDGRLVFGVRIAEDRSSFFHYRKAEQGPSLLCQIIDRRLH